MTPAARQVGGDDSWRWSGLVLAENGSSMRIAVGRDMSCYILVKNQTYAGVVIIFFVLFCSGRLPESMLDLETVLGTAEELGIRSGGRKFWTFVLNILGIGRGNLIRARARARAKGHLQLETAIKNNYRWSFSIGTCKFGCVIRLHLFVARQNLMVHMKFQEVRPCEDLGTVVRNRIVDAFPKVIGYPAMGAGSIVSRQPDDQLEGSSRMAQGMWSHSCELSFPCDLYPPVSFRVIEFATMETHNCKR